MQYDQVGINIDGIDKLILDIYNYAEKIQKALNEISNVIDQTKTFYSCDTADFYRNKFESFKTNFGIINKNIISYADDLIKLKCKYQTINSDMTQSLKKAALKVEQVGTRKWQIPGKINKV